MAVDGTVYTYPGELTRRPNADLPHRPRRRQNARGRGARCPAPPHAAAWCDEYALYGCPLAASHQPGTLYRWDWRNDTVQTIPMLVDEKIIACEAAAS